MPINVHVPIRLKLPATTLSHDLSAVETAVRQALGRALATSADEVLAPRGSYLGVTVHAPSVTWSGAGASEVGPRLRERVDAEVRRWVETVVEDSEVAAVQRRHDHAPEVMPASPSERLDRERIWRGMGRYVVPSYGGEVPEKQVMVFDDEPEIVLDANAPPPIWAWKQIRSENDVLDAIGDAAYRFGRRLVFPTRLGLIYWSALDEKFRVTIVDMPNRDDVTVRWSMAFDVPKRPAISGDGQWELVPGVPSPDSTYRLEVLGPIDGAARIAFYQESFGADVLAALEGIAVPDAMPEADRQKAIKARADEIVQRLAERWPADSYFFRVLGAGGRYIIASTPTWAQGAEAIELLPLAEMVAQRPASTEDGTAVMPPDAPMVRGEEGPRGGAKFPGSSEGDPVEAVERFLGEASVDLLGHWGVILKALIERIANRLEIPTSEYPAGFALRAVQVVAAHASGVDEYVESTPDATIPRPGGGGNFGDMQFTPQSTNSIQMLRYLGETMPLLTELVQTIMDCYLHEEFAALIEGLFQGEGIAWSLRFGRSYQWQAERSVGLIYVVACRAGMVQLLLSSRAALVGRLNDFERYASYFEAVAVTLLAEPARLMGLREQLQNAQAAELQSGSAVGAVVQHSWVGARTALADAYDSFFNPESSTRVLAHVEVADEKTQLIRDPKGKIIAIRDEAGRGWTLGQLEHAIGIQQSNAESIDPLIKQFVQQIPEVATLFRDAPYRARSMLRAKLEEMLEANAEVLNDTLSDLMYAFRAGVIREDLPHAEVPGAPGPLCGIHRTAHDLIGDAFMGDVSYENGLRWLFTVELGRLGIIDFLEMGIVFLVAVLCPPLAFAVGAAFAIWHKIEANEAKRVYEAFVDPDFVLSHADVELKMFMAELGLVLTFLPGAGKVLAKLGRGLLTVARGGTKAALRAGAKRVASTFSRAAIQEAMHELREELAKRVMEELFDELVVDNIVGMLLEPAFAKVAEEIQKTGTGNELLELVGPEPGEGY